MSRSRAPLLASSVFLFALLATLLPSLGRAQTAGHVVISEVMYDPVCSTTATNCEWVELFNPTAAAVDLTGWKVQDNNSQDSIPSFTLDSGAYLVIAANASGFAEGYPGFAGNLIILNNPIGNGLANGGDRIILKDSNGTDVDAMSYGTDTTYFSLQRPNNLEGHSLARVPPDVDTNTAADWSDLYPPGPGGPGIGPEPTPVGTSTSTPIRTATPTETPADSPPPTATATSTGTA